MKLTCTERQVIRTALRQKLLDATPSDVAEQAYLDKYEAMRIEIKTIIKKLGK